MIQDYLHKTFQIPTNLRGGPNFFGGNQFGRTAELFGTPFCISILKVLRIQILPHLLDFKAFCMVYEYLTKTFEISKS